MKKKSTQESAYESALLHRMLHVTRWLFVLCGAYAGAIIAFDSWNLITHEVVARRWTYGGMLAILITIVWFLLKKYARSLQMIQSLAYVLIIATTTFAGFNVYTQRGMASKAVMLFVIPLLIAAQLRNRAVLWATAGLSVCAYSIAAVRYFHLYYGEGYRIELYGEVGFYSALIIIIAGILIQSHARNK